MIYEPKQKGKRAQNISLVLFFLAIVAVYLSNAVAQSMQWIMQTVAIILLGAFIYVLVRWHFTGFKYEIKARSKMESAAIEAIPADRLQLYVHRRQGKRGYAAEFVCSLDDVEDVSLVSDGEKYKGKRFVFYKNIENDNRYVLRVKGESGPLFVFLEIDSDGKDFLGLIQNKIAG